MRSVQRLIIKVMRVAIDRWVSPGRTSSHTKRADLHGLDDRGSTRVGEDKSNPVRFHDDHGAHMVDALNLTGTSSIPLRKHELVAG